MEIKLEQTESNGAFYVEEIGVRLAEMTFSKAGSTILIIDHTDVSDSLHGKGAGRQLVKASVEHARKNSLKIIPLCPFAKSVFSRVEEFHDVLQSQ